MAATPRSFGDSSISGAKNRRRTVEERKGDRNESQTVLRACEVLKAFRNACAFPAGLSNPRRSP
jgi:hypothetical protein